MIMDESSGYSCLLFFSRPLIFFHPASNQTFCIVIFAKPSFEFIHDCVFTGCGGIGDRFVRRAGGLHPGSNRLGTGADRATHSGALESDRCC